MLARVKNKVKIVNRFSKTQLSVFVMIFAGLGTYFIINSFAASPTTANFWIDPNGGSCTRSASPAAYNDATACSSMTAAYNAAQNGDNVIIKAGGYGSQNFPKRSALDGGTCVSSGTKSGCVSFTIEAGANVNVGDISFGSNYTNDGPSNISIDASGGSLTTSYLGFTRAHEIYLKNIDVPGDLFMTGGSYITIMGGEFGPFSDNSGTHPEIQAVYNSNPVIKPTHIKFSGGYWHDYNTTNSTAHVDCLQIESGVDFTLENSRFNNCGSVGVRVSYGTNRNSEAPDGLLIQNNVFDKCANIPVSECYYSAELGNGNNVTIRNNTFLMEPQPTTSNGSPSNVTYVGNTGKITGCQTFGSNIVYRYNVWQSFSCGSTDVSVSNLMLNSDGSLKAGSPAIGRADPSNYPAYDILGISRPQGSAPDAGAYEYNDNTPPPPDTTPPTAPTSVTATATSATNVNLSWSGATDNVGVTNYLVYRYVTSAGSGSAAVIATLGNVSSYGDTSVVGNTGYSYYVVAKDGAGNTSPNSTTKSVTTPTPPDTTKPSTPTNATVSAASSTQVNLSWTASTDAGGSGLAGYNIYRNGSKLNSGLIAAVANPTYGDGTVKANTTYSYTIEAVDGAGNLSTKAATTPTSITTPDVSNPPDTTPPPKPSPPAASTSAATVTTATTITLTWPSVTDAGGSGLAGYKIYRNGTLVITADDTANSYTDYYLTPSTSYNYTITAFDNAGNDSSTSNTANLSTTSQIGDLDGDTHVTGHDLSILLSHFNTHYPRAEFDSYPLVQGHNLSILLSNYGK